MESVKRGAGRPPILDADGILKMQTQCSAAAQSLSATTQKDFDQRLEKERKATLERRGGNSLVILKPVSVRSKQYLLNQIAPVTVKQPCVLPKRRIAAVNDIMNSVSNAVVAQSILNPSAAHPNGLIRPWNCHNLDATSNLIGGTGQISVLPQKI